MTSKNSQFDIKFYFPVDAKTPKIVIKPTEIVVNDCIEEKLIVKGIDMEYLTGLSL